MQVIDVMHRDLVTVSPCDTVIHAAELMLEHRIVDWSELSPRAICFIASRTTPTATIHCSGRCSHRRRA